jgi:hypothetical protein
MRKQLRRAQTQGRAHNDIAICIGLNALVAVAELRVVENLLRAFEQKAGLVADLRKCQAEWESDRRISSFSLGTHDISDRCINRPYDTPPNIRFLRVNSSNWTARRGFEPNKVRLLGK